MNSLTVTIRKDRLFLGSSYTGIGRVTVLIKVRIYVRIVILERLKTSLAIVSLKATEFLKLFRSGVSKTNDNATLRVTVSTYLLRVDRSGNVSVSLNVHTFNTDLTKHTKKRCVGMDTVVIRK